MRVVMRDWVEWSGGGGGVFFSSRERQRERELFFPQQIRE